VLRILSTHHVEYIRISLSSSPSSYLSIVSYIVASLQHATPNPMTSSFPAHHSQVSLLSFPPFPPPPPQRTQSLSFPYPTLHPPSRLPLDLPSTYTNHPPFHRRKRRQRPRQRRRKTPPQNPARQYPRYHETRDPSSRASWRRKAYQCQYVPFRPLPPAALNPFYCPHNPRILINPPQ